MPGLDGAELRAFLMAQPRVIGDAPLAAAAERALDKFLAAMPVALRARAAFLRERLFIDTTGWRGVAENPQFLPVVQDAVSRDRKLAIDYRKPDGQLANRTIDPLGIVAKGMSWYLVANTPAGFGTFRVSRIEKPTVLEIPVTVSRRGLAATGGAAAAGRSSGSSDRPKTMIAITTLAITATMSVSLRTARSLAAHGVGVISRT